MISLLHTQIGRLIDAMTVICLINGIELGTQQRILHWALTDLPEKENER